MNSIYIGLGSNLGDSAAEIQLAIDHLRQSDGVRVIAVSSLYQTPPMGPQDQPDYLNAVVELQSTLDPLELLDRLQAIEQQQGRVRECHWGARTIDLDLLLYGDEVINHPRLQVPHPGVGERAFVLVPLQEIAGELLKIPGVGRVGERLTYCDCGEIVRIKE